MMSKPHKNLLDRIWARRNGLAPAAKFTTETLRIPMRDGVALGADLFMPAGTPSGLLLTRGPYGRSMLMALSAARAYAAQGYAVLFVSSRGTYDSDGGFDPMRTEADDGHDVIEWMRAQPWYPGKFATIGGSYLGHTQWAVLAQRSAEHVASVMQVSPHDFARHAWGTGTFNLDFIGWSEQMVTLGKSSAIGAIARMATAEKRLAPILEAVPIEPAATTYFAETAPWVTPRFVTPDIEHPFWSSMRHADAVEAVDIPVLLLTGWQDIFLRQTFEQYASLSGRGVDVGLTIGPWTHLALSREAAPIMTREGLAWLDDKLAGAPSRRESAVRIFVTGVNEWQELESWPPASQERRLVLQPGRLGDAVTDAAASTFTYDPMRPTPTVGGPIIQGGGYVEDSSLATRDDVLAYTGDPLESDTTVIGTPRVRLAHSTQLVDADLFVRLSEVDARGRSHNVTEGYVRLPADRGNSSVELDLLPTAHRFTAGNRIRLLIAGGSFPQFARNPGTGENPLIAAHLLPNEHTVAHADGVSTLTLPIV